MSDELLVPPTPVLFPGNRKLRFRVEGQDGLRSGTWNVIAHRNTDDVYLGLRARMGDVKLSLHRATWRMALTEPGARDLPAGQDRVLTRWAPTPERGGGWRRAVTIAIPTSSLATHPGEAGMTGRVSVYPAPRPGWGLRFDVLLGAADHQGLTVQAVAGEVGRLQLASGAIVWVITSEVPVEPAYEQWLQQIRDWAATRAGAAQEPRAWAWASEVDGGPVLFDLGATPIAGARPCPCG